MSIEAGARAGMIAPDDATYEYIAGKRFAPKGEKFDAAVKRWKQLPTDEGATYDRTLILEAADIAPQVTWGTNPGYGNRCNRTCARSSRYGHNR